MHYSMYISPCLQKGQRDKDAKKEMIEKRLYMADCRWDKDLLYPKDDNRKDISVNEEWIKVK